MTRRWFLSAAALAAKKKHPPPNVLLIVTDRHSLQAMGAAGNSYLRTPVMDRLAREGTRFANSWCTSPDCASARAGILTGCLPHTARVERAGDKPDAKVPTLGELFRDAGYETLWAGKWQLPESFPGARFPDTPAKGALDRGFDFLPFKVNDQSQAPFGDFTDERIAQAAANYATRSHPKPFLLGLSLHAPDDIGAWVEGRLPKGHPGPRPEEIPDKHLPLLPANFAASENEPEFIGRYRSPAVRTWDEKRWRQYLYAYYRMVERTDRNLGIVLDELRRTHQDENTLVVLTADHGEGMGAHRWTTRPMLYQEPLSVPLVFRWKGWVQANRTEKNAPASGMDIVPTLCELTRVAPPKYLHGKSLVGLLDGSGTPFRDSAFAELPPEKDGAPRGWAVRTTHWKYVRFPSGRNPEMFFDLHADPGETRNLAGAAEVEQELGAHRDLAAKWAESDRLPAAT